MQNLKNFISCSMYILLKFLIAIFEFINHQILIKFK